MHCIARVCLQDPCATGGTHRCCSGGTALFDSRKACCSSARTRSLSELGQLLDPGDVPLDSCQPGGIALFTARNAIHGTPGMVVRLTPRYIPRARSNLGFVRAGSSEAGGIGLGAPGCVCVCYSSWLAETCSRQGLLSRTCAVLARVYLMSLGAERAAAACV